MCGKVWMLPMSTCVQNELLIANFSMISGKIHISCSDKYQSTVQANLKKESSENSVSPQEFE